MGVLVRKLKKAPRTVKVLKTKEPKKKAMVVLRTTAHKSKAMVVLRTTAHKKKAMVVLRTTAAEDSSNDLIEDRAVTTNWLASLIYIDIRFMTNRYSLVISVEREN